MRVSPNRFCLSAPWPAVTKKRLENTLFSKRTGHFSCSACGLSPEVQPSDHLGAWREFWRCCLVLGKFVASQDGRMGRLAPSRWTFTPVIGRSRSRPASKKSARRIPSASRARKGDGKRRDRLDDARGSDGDGTVWWRDPETGGLSGVARRSLVAAAAQLAFAAVAIKSQRLYDVWRVAGWGESSWRSVTHASLARLWSAETRGWRERRDGG